jgi:hypothetical protein
MVTVKLNNLARTIKDPNTNSTHDPRKKKSIYFVATYFDE